MFNFKKSLKWVMSSIGILFLTMLIPIIFPNEGIVVFVYLIILEMSALIIIMCFFMVPYPYLKKRKFMSIYDWLDSDNEPDFLRVIFSEKPSEDYKQNITRAYNAILIYTNHDIKQLRLLQASLKTLNVESAWSIISQKILQLFSGPLIILAITSGITWGLDKDKFSMINPSFIIIILIFVIFILAIFVMFGLIKESQLSKRRNKLIEELINAAIENLK